MTRQKKSRKVGQIGIRKQESRPAEKKENTRRKKTPKGQKSGSRNSLVDDNVKSLNPAANNPGSKNKKLGSKKKIELIPKPEAEKPIKAMRHVEPSVKLEKVKEVLLPEEELALLEKDELLIALAERVEQGEVLTGKDAKYFNRNIARYDELVEILGLDEEDEFEADPMEQLGGSEWDDLMDKGQ